VATFLYLREDRDDRHDEAKDEIETDEELVQRAFSLNSTLMYISANMHYMLYRLPQEFLQLWIYVSKKE